MTSTNFAPKAPATKFVDYENVVFSSAFGIQSSPFQGHPSDLKDKLWADLYDCKLPPATN